MPQRSSTLNKSSSTPLDHGGRLAVNYPHHVDLARYERQQLNPAQRRGFCLARFVVSIRDHWKMDLKDMITRLLLLCLIAAPFAALADKKKTDDVEYLLPADFDDASAADNPAKKAGLALTVKTFQAGMKKNIGDDVDCKTAKLTALSSMKKGAVVYQQIDVSGAKLDVFLDIGPKSQITNARFESSVKDQDHLVAMLCATYGLMRTIEPKYITPAAAKKDALHLWQEAQAKPFTKAFMFNTFKAQMTPFQMNVF